MIDQYSRLNGVPYFQPNPFLSASLLDPQKNTMFGQIRVVNHVLSKMAEMWSSQNICEILMMMMVMVVMMMIVLMMMIMMMLMMMMLMMMMMMTMTTMLISS